MNDFQTTKQAVAGFIIETQSNLDDTIEWVKWNMGVTELTEEQTTEITEIFNSL